MTEKFSASVAGKHMACHASANLELAIPNWVEPTEEGKAAAAGTNKHAVAAEIMEWSANEIRGFATALEYVAALRSTRRFKVLIEQTVKATWLASQPSTTVDLVLYVTDEIHVIDWKFGKIPVMCADNEQLKYYAVSFANLAPKATGVHTHIVQPYADNYDSEFVSTTDLKLFMAEAQAAEAAILKGDLTFGPSDHCKFCPANPHSRSPKGHPLCPAMMQLLYPTHVNEDEILAL